MGKILYLATKPLNINAPDFLVNQLGNQLVNSDDLDIHIINEWEEELPDIIEKNYAMIIFDAEIAIPPWNLIKAIKSSSEIDCCPVFWVEGSINMHTSHYMQSNHLTGSILVTKNSQEIIAAFNGNVDGHLDSSAPLIKISTSHNICSIGKMLTGLTVLQLAKEGKLNLTDNIYDCLPEDFPNKEKFKTVTVNQLLTHTAGMGNYTEKYDRALNDPDQEDPQFKVLEDFLTFIDNPDELPVGEHNYSNVGYVVLGKVIEKAVNKDKRVNEHQNYWDVITALVLKPGNIAITRDKPPSDNAATNAEYPTTIKIASSPAGANMWAVPEELTKFANWLIGRIQNEPTFKSELDRLKVRMFANEELYYSAGIMMGKDSLDQDFYYHNGGAPGISSYLRLDPSTQMTETVFINNDSNNKELANGLVASTLESYVMNAQSNNVYYADPKLSTNPEVLFDQVAQQAGVILLADKTSTRRYRAAIVQAKQGNQSFGLPADKKSPDPFKITPKLPGDP